MVIVKTVKVSDKGQISIPLEVREAAGIYQGAELVLVESEGKILLEKAGAISSRVEDDFRDILKWNELALKEVWDNPEDDIWSTYLEK